MSIVSMIAAIIVPIVTATPLHCSYGAMVWCGTVWYGTGGGPPVSIVSMIAAIIVPNDGSQPHRSIVPGPFPFLTLPL